MSDRDGFLTPTDRDWLRGEKEYTGEHAKQQRYERRESIRSRSRDSLYDFSVLFHTLPDEELDKIRTVAPDEQDLYDRALVDTFAFLRRLTGDRYEELVGEGIEQAIEHEHAEAEHVAASVKAEVSTTVVTGDGEVEQEDTFRAAGTHSDPFVTANRISGNQEHYVEAFEQLEGHFEPEYYERLLAAIEELAPK